MRRIVVFVVLLCMIGVDAPASPAGKETEKTQKPTAVIRLSPTDDLAKQAQRASAGTLILLKDGVYPLTRPLVLAKRGVCLRSESGDRKKVIVDGFLGKGKLQRGACVNELVSVRASHITLADLTLRYARDHAIHVSPGKNHTITGVTLRNLHVYDCGQQLIKVNSNGGDPLYWVDKGILEDCLLEFQDHSIMDDHGKYFYTGGLDVHGGKGWIIRRNVFKNIQRDGKLMEHAVHMWSKSRGTLVEQNHFIDCYRAIGFGMKTRAHGAVRKYSDGMGDEPYLDHLGGIIRNNMIYNSKGVHLESGIELANVRGVKVLHNTVVSHDRPFSSIEYRWPNTHVEIRNNIVSHDIRQRNGAKAVVENNVLNAAPDLFVDYSGGDLHLSSSARQAINRGAVLPVAESARDIDDEARGNQPDIGADELPQVPGSEDQ